MKHHWFYLKWYLLKRSRSPLQGFTMLEVLAALMISFAFLMGTLNALAITALMQVKAERQAQAMYWIQRDLESVRASAANYSQTGCNNLAQNVINQLPTIAQPTQSLFGRTYRISRGGPTISGNILQLRYVVGENYSTSTANPKYDSNPTDQIADEKDPSNQDTLTPYAAFLYTEILPQAAITNSCS